MSEPKLQIVTNPSKDQPYHARVIGGNGEPLMWSENYSDIYDAEHCLLVSKRAFLAGVGQFTIEYVDIPLPAGKAADVPAESRGPRKKWPAEPEPLEKEEN